MDNRFLLFGVVMIGMLVGFVAYDQQRAKNKKDELNLPAEAAKAREGVNAPKEEFKGIMKQQYDEVKKRLDEQRK